MKLSLDLIVENMSMFNAKLILSREETFEFTSVQILTLPAEDLSEEVLYICGPKILPKLSKQQISSHCFVLKDPQQQIYRCKHPVNAIVFDDEFAQNDVINHLVSLFAKTGEYECRIKDAALRRQGYEPFFVVARDMFPNCHIVVTDSAYNIMCATKPSCESNENVKGILARGYYNKEDLDAMSSHGYVDDLRKYSRPILYDSTKTICGRPFLLRSYKMHGATFSFIGCYFTDCEPTLLDLTLFTCFSNELDTYYHTNGILNEGVSTGEQLIDDLVNERQSSIEFFRDRAVQLRIPYQGNFRIGLIQTGMNNTSKAAQMVNQLRTFCTIQNYGIFQYGSSILMLLHDWHSYGMKEKSELDEGFEAMEKTLEAHNSHIGISLLFTDLTKFSVGYKQAFAAAQHGYAASNRTISFYSEYYLNDILKKYSEHIPLEYVYSPYLDKLIEENTGGCSNMMLLHQYLLAERNISLAAKRVNMHRNSVIYRLQKIQDMLGLDLDDPNVRLRLMISIKILEMLNKIPKLDQINPNTPCSMIE